MAIASPYRAAARAEMVAVDAAARPMRHLSQVVLARAAVRAAMRHRLPGMALRHRPARLQLKVGSRASMIRPAAKPTPAAKETVAAAETAAVAVEAVKVAKVAAPVATAADVAVAIMGRRPSRRAASVSERPVITGARRQRWRSIGRRSLVTSGHDRVLI